MIYSGAKMIEIPITRTGRNYFPDVQDLYGRTIQALTLFPDCNPLNGGGIYPTDYEDWSVNLTADGQNYDLLNTPAAEFVNERVLGKPLELNMPLSLENCYIDARTVTSTGLLVAVVWFEADAQYRATAKTDLCSYNSFDINIVLMPGYRNYFPDNRDMAGKHFRGFNRDRAMETTPFGQVVADIDSNATYLTFVKGTYALMERVPLVAFEQTSFIERQKFDNIVFDFENSYLELSDINDTGALNITCEFER